MGTKTKKDNHDENLKKQAKRSRIKREIYSFFYKYKAKMIKINK